MSRRSATSYSSMRLAGFELEDSPGRSAVLDFLSAQPLYHFTQHPDWACKHNPSDFIGVATLVGGEIAAWTLVRARKVRALPVYKYYGERGPVLSSTQIAGRHVQDLQANLGYRGLFLVMHPYAFGEAAARLEAALVEAGCQPWHKYRQHYSHTLVIDLRHSLASIRGDFRRSFRTQINKAERLGLVVTEASRSSEFVAFAEACRQAMRRQGLATPTNLASLLSGFASGSRGCTLMTWVRGEPVAGIALIGCGENLVYQWGYTSQDPNLRRLPLHHALHWNALQLAKQNGYRAYDMGGYWLSEGDKNPINRFKTGLTKNICSLPPPLAVPFSLAGKIALS